jgi:hypothetical protein
MVADKQHPHLRLKDIYVAFTKKNKLTCLHPGLRRFPYFTLGFYILQYLSGGVQNFFEAISEIVVHCPA